MKSFISIALLFSISAAGQTSQNIKERQRVYQQVTKQLIDKNYFVINETFVHLSPYDIDGDYARWRRQFGSQIAFICVEPVQYENTVTDYLSSTGIWLDTADVFQQVKNAKTDSLCKYNVDANLISFKQAPFRSSFIGNLFKKKKAVVLSPVIFDERNHIALVSLHIISKNKQSSANHSMIIILKKQDNDWHIASVLHQKPVTR